MAAPYVGRFAPSPTGPLHVGSLLAALASWLDARAVGGAWHLRIEDLDAPRCVQGAAESILDTLAAFGLTHDGPVVWQSQRIAAYEAALAELADHIYPCACSRREIADSSLQGVDGPVYPGTCREGTGGRPARALRVRVHDRAIGFDDRIRGRITQHLEIDVGDFVVHRADGIFAYQLAVVVDDAAQRVSGSALDFCYLVTQRRPSAALDLVAEGPQADTWLGIAQAFAGPPGPGR
jgi:glutamyl-Q tRNA(Asp) synthetase